MNTRFALKALATAALLASAAPASAAETVVWWDFLGGGDGIRMKALLEQFNTEHAGAITIEATTLPWGTAFYAKVQTSAAVGEGPDVMTYHLSRLPIGVESGALAEISAADLATVGLGPDTYAASNWGAAQVGGKIYAVPFDIHSVVLYYNKDKLGEAGLLDDAGLPAGLDGTENFLAGLKTLQGAGSEYGISIHSAAGDSMWRIFYSLLGQQDGQFLDADGNFLSGDNLDKAVKATSVIQQWVADGLAPALTEYPASIALFTSGAAAMHINGVWEVPTFTDLAAKGELFNWGAVALPTFFDHPATWADSHAFAIPNNVGKEMTPEKKAAVLEVISWMNKNSLAWAGAGHIPSYSPVRDSAEFKTLQPNAVYSVLAATAVFDPVSVLAGVASPIYDAAGNYLMPAINGEMEAQAAMEEMRDDLQEQAE